MLDPRQSPAPTADKVAVEHALQPKPSSPRPPVSLQASPGVYATRLEELSSAVLRRVRRFVAKARSARSMPVTRSSSSPSLHYQVKS
eukprot:14637871-Heterocapsa_arctica.AAC.1